MSLDGSIDEITPAGNVRGWACRPGHVERLRIGIFRDDRLVAEAVAQHYRADLLAAGMGLGHCAFTARLREPLALGEHTLDMAAIGLVVEPLRCVVPVPDMSALDPSPPPDDGWTDEELARSVGHLDLEQQLARLGPAQFVDGLCQFVLGRWASPDEIEAVWAACADGHFDPVAFFCELLDSHERHEGQGPLPGPFHPAFPFRYAGTRSTARPQGAREARRALNFLSRPRDPEHAPPLIAAFDAAAPGTDFRLPVRDPTASFYTHPLFADRADADWFNQRAWNGTPPTVGPQRGESFIRRETDKFVVMHRYGEGVIFDRHGTSNSAGFLNNLLTLPEGLHREGDHFVVDPAVLARAPRLPGARIVFYNGNLQNYYHWMVEAMLAIHLLDTEPSLADRTVLPAHLPHEGQFDHLGIMRLLGHGHLAIDRVDAPFVHCETVVHLEAGEIETYPAAALRAFRDRHAVRFRDAGAGHRALILRRHLRGVANQPELDAILEPLGFRAHYLEDLSAEAQIRLFASASMIVSPHGAGLSNLIFAPAGCKVIEFMPECQMRPFFWQIGTKLEHTYGMLPCPTQDGGFNGHLTIDIEKFRSLLTMVLAQR